MDNRSFESAASATPPSAPASPSSGYPTNGNPTSAIPATLPGEYWFHQIGEELRAAIVAGGLTPAAGTLNQLATAIFGAKSLTANGYQTLPGGLILQWATGTASTAGEVSETVTLPITFPTACLLPFVSTINPSANGGADVSYQIVSFAANSVTVFRQQNPVNSISCSPAVFAIGY